MARDLQRDQQRQQLQEQIRLQRQQQEQQEYLYQQQIAAAYAGIISQLEKLDPELRENKILSVEIYLDTDEMCRTEQVNESVAKMIDYLGFNVTWDLGAIISSWFKRLFIRSKEAVTHPELVRRFDEVEHGLQTYLISRHQSEIDANQADAASKLIESLAAIPNAVVKIGSLLIVKKTGPNAQASVVVKSLSICEMIVLSKHPDLLKRPTEILENLAHEADASQDVQSKAIRAPGP